MLDLVLLEIQLAFVFKTFVHSLQKTLQTMQRNTFTPHTNCLRFLNNNLYACAKTTHAFRFRALQTMAKAWRLQVRVSSIVYECGVECGGARQRAKFY